MAIQSPVPNQSVEEILASIRQAIAEDESRRGRSLKPVSPLPPPSQDRTPSAARGFSSANDDDWGAETDFETQNVIDLAIEKAIDGVSAALSDNVRSSPHGSDRPARPAARDERAQARPNSPPPRPLLSARTGAAVAASFDDLARNVASLSQAQVQEMAQEMLRPILKSWLDDNLPSLVERLVREEIERVSRGR
jgi:cell pole-organizing protein PopZ